MRQFLTDFDEPRRFLEIDGAGGRGLDVEPCGELDIAVQQIGAGGDSKFLPEVCTSHYSLHQKATQLFIFIFLPSFHSFLIQQVYRELYEEGNIVMS